MEAAAYSCASARIPPTPAWPGLVWWDQSPTPPDKKTTPAATKQLILTNKKSKNSKVLPVVEVHFVLVWSGDEID